MSKKATKQSRKTARRKAAQALEWLWGSPLGKLVKVKSWRPSLDLHFLDWRDRGVAWPTLLVDRRGMRWTSTPIWNFIWLRNRLGFGEKD